MVVKPAIWLGTTALLGASALGAYTANYTASDMPDIATDVIGEGGVQIKTYMPILVLGFVALVVVGIVVKIKRAR